MAPFINWSQLCGAALNFLFIISVHNRAVFRHDKCVRIIFQDNRSQMADLILGNQNVEDVNRLSRVFANPFLSRNAAVQIHKNLLLHFRTQQLGDNRNLLVDVLHM